METFGDGRVFIDRLITGQWVRAMDLEEGPVDEASGVEEVVKSPPYVLYGGDAVAAEAATLRVAVAEDVIVAVGAVEGQFGLVIEEVLVVN